MEQKEEDEEEKKRSRRREIGRGEVGGNKEVEEGDTK